MNAVARIIDDPLVRILCVRMMEEARQIGRAIGIAPTLSVEEMIATARTLGDFETSMLQDVEQIRGAKPRGAHDMTSQPGGMLHRAGQEAGFRAVRRSERVGPDPFPVRVLFVQDHLGQSAEAIHGVTRYFLSTLPAFDRRIVEPSLCVLSARHPLGALLLEAQGIEPVFLGRGKWDPRPLPDLIRLVRDRHIDTLHVSGFKGTMLGRSAALATRRAAIAHLHDARPMAPWLRLIQHRLARWTDAAIVVSEAMRQVALADYGLPWPKRSPRY